MSEEPSTIVKFQRYMQRSMGGHSWPLLLLCSRLWSWVLPMDSILQVVAAFGDDEENNFGWVDRSNGYGTLSN